MIWTVLIHSPESNFFEVNGFWWNIVYKSLMVQMRAQQVAADNLCLRSGCEMCGLNFFSCGDSVSNVPVRLKTLKKNLLERYNFEFWNVMLGKIFSDMHWTKVLGSKVP